MHHSNYTAIYMVKRGYQLVRDHAEKKQRYQKDMFDRKVKGQPYHINDLVFLHNVVVPKDTQESSADYGWGLLTISQVTEQYCATGAILKPLCLSTQLTLCSKQHIDQLFPGHISASC